MSRIPKDAVLWRGGVRGGVSPDRSNTNAREAREIFLEERACLGFADCVAEREGAGRAGASRAIFADVGA
jgi:hypothetical protein